MFITKSVKFVSKKIRSLISSLGPGFISGAADDDPSGIATYTIVGATFGFALNWLVIVSIPLMIAVQEVCARIGITTGKGLAGVIRSHYSKKLLYLIVILLATANIINIGADLGAMADVATMVIGFPWWVWLVLITLVTIILEVLVPYKNYEAFLKWFSLSLFAYLFTAIIVSPSFPTILASLILPQITLSLPFFAAIVGFLGTSISPYLFFWQTSEEVEVEIAEKRIHGFGMGTPRFNKGDIKRMRIDTNLGMIFSQGIALAVMITAAATLNKNGLISISSASEAAAALRPLAGDFSYILFALGIFCIGLQAIPILAASLAYAVAEVFQAPEGLGKSLSRAKLFYTVIISASLLGAIINLLGINPIKALYYSAIINGIIAVPLIFAVTMIGANNKIMGRETSGKLSRTFTFATSIIMATAVLIMIYLILRG